MRADLQVAARVEPGHGSAARADGVDLERRHVDRVVVDDGVARADGLAVHDEADEERRASDVGGDDVRVAELRRQRPRPDDAAGQDAPDRADGGTRGLGRRDGAAVALHDEQRSGQAVGPERRLERPEVGAEARSDLGAHDRRGAPGELPDAGADLAGQAHEQVGGGLVDEFAEPLLVGGVAEGPQQRDGDGLDALGDEGVDGGAGRSFVERDDDVAVPVEPLRDLEGEALGDQRVGLGLPHDVLEILGRAPEVSAFDVHDEDRVAVPGGGEEADPRDVAGDEGVERRRRPVREVVHVGEHRLERLAAFLRERSQDVEDTCGVVGGRRGDLGREDAARVVDQDRVGEGAPDVHPHNQ